MVTGVRLPSWPDAFSVEFLLEVTTEAGQPGLANISMWELGTSNAVVHNEVAPDSMFRGHEARQPVSLDLGHPEMWKPLTFRSALHSSPWVEPTLILTHKGASVERIMRAHGRLGT